MPTLSAARPDPSDHHAAMHQGLRWQVDENFNIAQVCSRRWAQSQPEAPAIIEHRQGHAPRVYSYGQLQRAADALSRVLKGLGRGCTAMASCSARPMP